MTKRLRLIPKLRKILNRSSSKKVASNYSSAIDGNISVIRDILTAGIDKINKFLKINIPKGLSNCTLTTTQWIDPNLPIMKAQTIIDNGRKYGYVEIPESHATVGDLVIATNPQNNAHHTMLIHDFTTKPLDVQFLGTTYKVPSGHPLVRYSTGTTDLSGYRESIPLMAYIDHSEGKTDVKYYRHFDPDHKEILLPEIDVTPSGNYISNNPIISINKNGGQLPIETEHNKKYLKFLLNHVASINNRSNNNQYYAQ